MTEKFEIGGVVVAPGERGFVRLPVANLLMGSDLTLPVNIVHGALPGPVIGLTSGIHGQEYLPILFLKEALEQIDPARLRGTVLAMPVASPVSLELETRFSPLEEDMDFGNLNRVFPGVRAKAAFGPGASHPTDRTLTERIAEVIARQFLPRLNHLIDFHSGPPYMAIAKVIVQALPGRQGEINRGMGRAFGLGLIHEYPSGTGTVTGYAATLGVSACVGEIGGAGFRLEAQARCVHLGARGILNVMKYLNMLDGEPEIPERQFVYDTAPQVRPTVSGYLMNRYDREALFEGKEIGIHVQSGELLARVFDHYSFKELEEVRAPVDGILYFARGAGLVQAGGRGYSTAPFAGGHWIQ